ncbi:hypothetical protein N9C70_01725 [Flavobacteriales bacterium]|nr:hypothetical protein [Flavobacteriales bacterium]
MKNFLIFCLSVFTPAVTILWTLWILPLLVSPEEDPNLGRLFHHNHSGLICGTSRTEQGIDPKSLASSCPELTGIYNYSFNLGDSPWSTQYASAITNKLGQSSDSTSGILILSIDPWSLRNSKPNPSKFLGLLQDNEWIQTHLYATCTSPLQSITGTSEKEISKALLTAIRSGQSTKYILQPNGWLPNTRFRDSAFSAIETQKKITSYLSLYPRTVSWPEKEAISAIKTTIRAFQKQRPEGTLVFIRPPVRAEMLLLENSIYPELNEIGDSIAKEHDASFLDCNLISKDLVFNDAHHLYHESAKTFSIRLGAWICEVMNK